MNRERVIFNNMLYFLISKAVLELTDILNRKFLAISENPNFLIYTTCQKKRDTFYFSIESPIKLTLREQL